MKRPLFFNKLGANHHIFMIINRIIGWDIRPVSYKPSKYLIGSRIERDLIDEIARFSDGALDDGNGEVLDTKIATVGERAIMDLVAQRQSHIDTIREEGIRHSVDGGDFTRQLDKLKDEKIALENQRLNLQNILDMQDESQKKAICSQI